MNLKDIAQNLEHQMILDRRFLHQYPELSNQEFKTTNFIRQRLTEFKIPIEPLNLKTGLSALIKGSHEGPTICIRHDIDALPIQEITNLPFKSQHEGVSHACGHDIHTIIALYCAKILNDNKDLLHGNVRIVFQPAEEVGTGAKDMIAKGLMDLEPKQDIVIGLHTHPLTPVGKICLRKGPMEAGADFFTITIKGESGHGAYPHKCVNPIIVSAYLITQLQTIISQENPAVQSAVLSIGAINGGNTNNTIPEEVTIKGSLRTLYKSSRDGCITALHRMVENVCMSMRATAQIDFSAASLPPISNDTQVYEDIINAANQILGPNNVIDFEFPSMGSDDFGIFLNYSKGAQFFLGTANDDCNSQIGLHNGANHFDEKSLITGVQVLCQYIFNTLKEH